MDKEGHTESTKKYNLAKGKQIKYDGFALRHRKEERMCTVLGTNQGFKIRAR